MLAITRIGYDEDYSLDGRLILFSKKKIQQKNEIYVLLINCALILNGYTDIPESDCKNDCQNEW